VAPVQCSVWLSGTFGRLRKVCRDAITNLLAQPRVRVRVHAFGNEHSIRESIDLKWRLALQAMLIGRRQAKAKPNTKFIQQRLNLCLAQLRHQCRVAGAG
jgi:hypothetical protein